MNTLKLTLRKKWFEMILSGEKKEEYREIKSFWNVRLLNWPFSKTSNSLKDIQIHIECCPRKVFKPFEFVEFKNGYSKYAPTMLVEIKNIKIDTGQIEWGAAIGEQYFVIELGNIIETKNLKL